MKQIFQTRFMHWKKRWKGLLFWLGLPIISTFLFMQLTAIIQADSKIPIGIVLEEDTALSNDLYRSIDQISFVRLYKLSEHAAIHKLQKHELDSVFIIHPDFEKQIYANQRTQLISGYKSNLSFAYTPVKEAILSFVQQESGRVKAADVIHKLAIKSTEQSIFKTEDIIRTSKEIQNNEQLFSTSLSFVHNGDIQTNTNKLPIDLWGIWALTSCLATFLLFDWVIKENNPSIRQRLIFTKQAFPQYILKNTLLYYGLFCLIDLMTLIIFMIGFDEQFTLTKMFSVLSYRLMLLIGACLLALMSRNRGYYYNLSFVIVLFIAITCGLVLPIDQMDGLYQLLYKFNPLHAFLNGQVTYGWNIILIVFIFLWYMRKVDINASYRKVNKKI